MSEQATLNGTAHAPVVKPTSKREAVNLAFAAGVTMPRDVVGYIKEHFDIDITPAHVSTLKGLLKKPSNGEPKKRGRPATRMGHPLVTMTVGEGMNGPPVFRQSGMLSVDDLSTLADLAKRVGGAGELIRFLGVLGGIHA